MAKDSAIAQRNATALFCSEERKVLKFKSELLSAEVLANLAFFTLDPKVHELVNYPDEDLYLLIAERGQKEPPRPERVNYLCYKELQMENGKDYLIRLGAAEKFSFSVSTTAHYMPKVVLIRETIGRYLLTWSDIDWQNISNEVGRDCGLIWSRDIDVVLKVFRAKGELVEQEWIYPGERDSWIVGGEVLFMVLAVVRKRDGITLKDIFRVDIGSGKTKRILDELEIYTLPLEPRLDLCREIYEVDEVNLRARWWIPDGAWTRVEKELLVRENLSWQDVDAVIRLFMISNGRRVEFDPQSIKKIYGTDNWLFSHLPSGCAYQAGLYLRVRAKEEILEVPLVLSPEVVVPERFDRINLLPIDERRIYAYWYVDFDGARSRICSKHHVDWSRVRTYIRVFHDYAGQCFHHMNLDVEVRLDSCRNWYLWVDPDRVYRVQLIAVVDGWKVEELTALSNPVQTARVQPGRDPVRYIHVRQSADHPTVRQIHSQMGTDRYSIGKMIFHLHAHLPFIGKRINYGTAGYWRPSGYVEEWYHEALRETYIPLVNLFDTLLAEGVDFKLSMDISPTLCAMMRSPILQEEFLNYLDSLIALARTEVERTKREEPWYSEPAWMHLENFIGVKDTFLRYGGELTRAFRKFQDLGHLEIVTCAATHGFLPLVGIYPEAIRGQVNTAVDDYECIFGRKPVGIWLPECAYAPGIEKILEEYGLRYFFSESHTVLLADSHVEFGVHAPVYIRGSSVAVFPRDQETGKQVWSGEEGYPGDPDYLEFHIRGGVFKYNRITDRTGKRKEPYVRAWALEKAARHAQHFIENRNFRFEYIRNWFWKKPLVVATYDAELFGHHWYEGMWFLYFLLKKLYYDQNETELTTPSHYLAEYPRNQEIFPTPSSWGYKGTFDKWMYGSVSWMYEHMNNAVLEMSRMARAASKKGELSSLLYRILQQAAREVNLAQNSDAAFNITNQHFVDRMKEMFFDNLDNFWRLSSMFWKRIGGGEIDEVELGILERRNPIFPAIDPMVYA